MAGTSTGKPDPERALMIKVKACQRLAKEALFYKKEAQENEAKLAEMKSSGEGNVKQMENVLEETLSMIPHSETLLQKNLEELSAMVLQQEEQEEAGGGEWLSAAKKLLEENGMGGDGGDAEEETTKVDDLVDGEAF